MNHQPFEEWLLNDKHLSPAEGRELDAHLRMCTHCTALAETGLALRSAKAAAPSSGFTLRFQQHLAIHKIAERRRKLWGLIVLIAVGAALFGWLAVPYLYGFATSPVEGFTAAVSYFLFVFTSLRAVSEALMVFVRLIPNFISPYMWIVILSALAGLGLLGSISIWRFARIPQGASV
jgi:hypothetical protein